VRSWTGWYSPEAGAKPSNHTGLKAGPPFENAASGLMKTLHQLSLSGPRAFSLVFTLLCLVGWAASAHAPCAGPRGLLSPPHVRSQFAVADFDGDRRPDLATVHVGQSSFWVTHYWIAFQLSGGSRQTLGIAAPTGGLQITSRDVNGDDFLDVIVTTAWTNQPVAVLLNDGQGNFTASKPSTFPGAFTTSEKSWASLTDEVKDATAVVLSRYPLGNCSVDGRFSSPRNVTRLLVLWAPSNSPLSALVSFLGRAPPFVVLHI
jgi:hypothetical protein